MIDERTASDIRSIVKGIEYLTSALDAVSDRQRYMSQACAEANVAAHVVFLRRRFDEMVSESITDSKTAAAMRWNMLNKQYDKIHLILDSICEKGRQWNPQPQSSSSAETSDPTKASSP